MDKVVTTESGSKYWIGENFIQRVEANHELRRDGESIPLLEIGRIIVGVPMQMMLDLRGDGVKTLRTTSRVTDIQELGEVS
jgi:hypothetical protein